MNFVIFYFFFEGKYCEFHKVYKSGKFKDAAELLISLLASKITPK